MNVNDLPDFDAARFLDDEETIHHYLAMSFESGDPVEIQTALGTVARARGMTALARESGIAREALYRALSAKGNAEFATIMKVIAAMGLHVTLAVGKAAGAEKAAPKAKTARAVKTAPAPKRPTAKAAKPRTTSRARTAPAHA